MGSALPLSFEIISSIVFLAILLADLALIIARPHIPSPKECTLWVAFYVLLALVFAFVLFAIGQPEHAGEFLTGWLTEYSLSINNLFVFVLIMARFSVPARYQQWALMVGVIIALVLRGIFIAVGATLLASFSWVFYLFGALLLYTAVRQLLPSNDDDGDDEGALARFLRKRFSVSDQFDGTKLRTTVAERRMFTPMVIVLLALGVTDVMFALDSIPAIFGITQIAFLVLAANVFALMGLRQLYFLLGHLIAKLEYLKYGIAAILAFIGVKLLLHALHENQLPFIAGGQAVAWAPDISTWVSLAVILGCMAAATIASLVKLRVDARAAERCDSPT